LQLDPVTLIFVNVATLLAMSIALPVVMGQDLSLAARYFRRSLVLKAMAWLSLALAGARVGQRPELYMATLSLLLMGWSNWITFRALNLWLGPRKGGALLLAFIALAPLGYVLYFDNPLMRAAWSSTLLAAQALFLASATLRPALDSSTRGRWRYLMLGSWAGVGVLSLLRGMMPMIYPELTAHYRLPTPINTLTLLGTNIVLVLVTVAALAAWREEVLMQLHKLIETDPLTGLINRKGWAEQAGRALRLAQRHGQSVSLLMLDLDHFKNINDTYGHEAGDNALKHFGAVMLNCQRTGDICARLGGEEFCILLVQTHPSVGASVDQRLRVELTQSRNHKNPYTLSFSAGLAHSTPQDTLETLMARADAAMYRAKNSGRGQLYNDTPMPAQSTA
jgi:diguanylate cyclase (GGDEF)-like protein